MREVMAMAQDGGAESVVDVELDGAYDDVVDDRRDRDPCSEVSRLRDSEEAMLSTPAS
jgi:K+/H+ antiporter YhaU regulatory subunit KhtT